MARVGGRILREERKSRGAGLRGTGREGTHGPEEDPASSGLRRVGAILQLPVALAAHSVPGG